MNAKAWIASKSPLVFRLINAVCSKYDINAVFWRENENLFDNLTNENPGIIFIDESVLDQNSIFLIDQIKQIKGFSEIPVIITSSDISYAQITQNIGGDGFLPIPFSDVKFNSILRNFQMRAKQILIVNENKDYIRDFYEALEKTGYSIHYCRNGDECMMTTHRIFPDLILTSYQLEDMTGAQLCVRIKNANLASHIPVLCFSDKNDAFIVDECLDAGVQDVLLYPLNQKENFNKLASILPPPKKGRKIRALVIDDSPIVRNLILKMLRNLDFTVNTAPNGLEGLNIAKKFKPDIITCDYDMPIMTGWQFCIEAKKDERINDIPIIMITARGSETDRKKGKVLGVAEYLPKPFKEQELEEIVTRVLQDSKKEKEKKAISKYVAKDTIKKVSEVIGDTDSLEPEEKFITIFFSDICSFTPMCEKSTPKEVVRLLNEYFDIMIRTLLDNNAIIDKLIGDAIVVRFDSGDRETDAMNAVKSAHEMLVALRQFNQLSPEKIEIRIGINSGKVILGNIGCESFRLDYTMIGDNVNITQRLEAAAPSSTCLISASTYNLIKDFVEVGDILTLSLKGKSKPVEAYPLVALLSENN
jgi:CheY-like chemotaxis protein